jgi:N-acetylmuramoyl-L-alanine amidase
VLALFETYPSLQEIVGHEDIAPHRKKDPGPAFPMSHFRSLVTGRKDDAQVEQTLLHAATTGLNLRMGPTVESAKVLDSVLPKGTRVEVIDRSGMWCKVVVQDAIDGDAGHKGWVSGKYLEKLA